MWSAKTHKEDGEKKVEVPLRTKFIEQTYFSHSRKLSWDDIDLSKFQMSNAATTGNLFSPKLIALSPMIRSNSSHGERYSNCCFGLNLLTPKGSGLSSDDSYSQYPMTKITDSLYIGSDIDSNNLKLLRREKITHCLSVVARKWNNEKWSAFRRYMGIKDIKRKCVPMSDFGNTDVVKLLQEKDVLAFMEESQKKKNKLLVHCHLGQNRSPTLVMVFLMKQKNLTFYQSWRVVKKKRLIVQPNKNYIKQLRDWDMYLHGKHSTPPDFLSLRVSGEDIKLKHENTSTERMGIVMVESMEKLRDSSTVFFGSSDHRDEEAELNQLGSSSSFIYSDPLDKKGKIQDLVLVDIKSV